MDRGTRGAKRKRLQVDSILSNKRSKLTQSTKNHTWQSFTNRIARLKIDPIRRTHTRTVAEDDVNATTSHFRTAFDNWVELNLSEDFVKFSRAVAPLSDSLPQILHHADDIFNLLLLHIEQGTVVSLQPVLDLVSQFAHDLGTRFEDKFPAALNAITKLAATNADVEVIEWSFTCLAWLFKYLSKLLVPDLRPLYDVMAPLLGKSKQKTFVSRFAAESLSFLLRRASVSYHINPIWLQSIIKHIVTDVCASRDIRTIEQFELGLISLFSEAIKGAKETLSNNGNFIFAELLKACLETLGDDFHSNPAFQTVQGVLTALLHETNDQTFEPIIQTIISPKIDDDKQVSQRLEVRLQLLMQLTCYRKGQNVKDWGEVLDFLAATVEFASSIDKPADIQPDILAAIVLCHNFCTVDVAIRHIKLLDKLCEGAWADHFPAFCDFYSQFGNDRFQTFALQKFQKFVNLKWKTYEDELLDLIPKLTSRGLKHGTILIPQAWRDSLAAELENHGESAPLGDASTFRNFAIIEMLCATSEKSTVAKYTSHLWALLEPPAGRDELPAATGLSFVLGRLLEHIVALDQSTAHRPVVWSLICSQFKALVNRDSFWKATAEFVDANTRSIDFSVPNFPQFLTSIYSALQSPSHEIRRHALHILATLQQKKHGKEAEILSVANLVEQTPPNIETFRSISMQIRKLGMLYSAVSSDAWLSTAIPSYCFGLLRVKFAPIWEASVSALKDIGETKEGALVIGEVALQWLGEDITESFADAVDGSLNSPAEKTLDIDSINNDIEELFRSPGTVLGRMETEFQKAHPLSPGVTMRDRSQALLLLKAVPQIAEKKSRALVPVLLEWVHHESSGDDGDDTNAASRNEAQKWGRKDLKAMLSVFASFKNPKSLFKADEVYQAILTLLCHGDAEIQKSALQAVFSRKNDNINRYQEGLLNLLDDAKFKEQFSTFLTIGADEDSLRDEHRADLMPIALRVLFGRIISRSKGDQQKGNKRAVFSVISRLGQQEANWFLDITLGPLCKVSLVENGEFAEAQLRENYTSQRRQLGLLNMLNDILGFLGATTAPYAHRLIDPIFYCLLRSARDEQSISTNEAAHGNGPGKGLAKSIRTLAMHCLDHLFNICTEFDWNPYIPILWNELVFPRLDKFHLWYLVKIAKLHSLLDFQRFTSFEQGSRMYRLPIHKGSCKTFCCWRLLLAVI